MADQAGAAPEKQQQPPKPKEEEQAATHPPSSSSSASSSAPPAQPKDDAVSSRIIYGKDIASESDEIKYKWSAIFYNYSPAQRALLALDEVSMYSITDTR